MFQFVVAWGVVKIAFEGFHHISPVEHFGLIMIGFYVVLGLGVWWFIRRAYIGMERDMDFYRED